MLKFSRRSNICSVITVLLSSAQSLAGWSELCGVRDLTQLTLIGQQAASLGKLNSAVQKSIIDVSYSGGFIFLTRPSPSFLDTDNHVNLIRYRLLLYKSYWVLKSLIGPYFVSQNQEPHFQTFYIFTLVERPFGLDFFSL